jgi:uncharacterized protein (UPF0333 family)
LRSRFPEKQCQTGKEFAFSLIVLILIIVIVLALLGFFGRGRARR